MLREVSFSIEAPGIYVVLGANGAGKTTLFRTLAGVLRPFSGEVHIGGSGAASTRSRERIHYLSHVDGIPEGLRVREALEFYARVERADRGQVDRVLDQLGLRELSGSYVSRLSAGQRKRVSIARVFLQERNIYLLDEPKSNLDPKLAREIRSLVLELGRDKIVLYSSHNLFEAREIGQYVLAIKSGRIALFDRLENVRGSRYLVGIRLVEPSTAIDERLRQGDYYVYELAGPEQVPPLLSDLLARGVKIREIREMENPLEDLFA